MMIMVAGERKKLAAPPRRTAFPDLSVREPAFISVTKA